MAEIKWTNVDGAALNGAVSNSQSAVNAFTAQLNQLGSNTKDFTTELQQRADETAEWNRSQNTQRIVNQMLNADSLEALQQMQAEGVGDAQTALSQYGGQIDLAALNKSKATWVADTQNRALAKDSLRDYTDIAQKRRAEILNLANNGGEAEALKLLNASGDIFSNKTLGELQATISGRIDANRRFLLDSRLAAVQEKNADVNARVQEATARQINANTQTTELTNNKTITDNAIALVKEAGDIRKTQAKIDTDIKEAQTKFSTGISNLFGKPLKDAKAKAEETGTLDLYNDLQNAITSGDSQAINATAARFNNASGADITFSGDSLEVLQNLRSEYDTSMKAVQELKAQVGINIDVLRAKGQTINDNGQPDIKVENSSKVSTEESSKAHRDLVGSGSGQESYTKEINKQESQLQKISSSVNGIGVSGSTNQIDNKHSKTEVTQTGSDTNQQSNVTNDGSTGSTSSSVSTAQKISIQNNQGDFSAAYNLLDDIKKTDNKSVLTANDITAHTVGNIVDSANGYTKKQGASASEYINTLESTHKALLAGRKEALDNGNTELVQEFETHLAQVTSKLREARKQENEAKVLQASGLPENAESIEKNIANDPNKVKEQLDNADKQYDKNNNLESKVGDFANTEENDAREVQRMHAEFAKFKTTDEITAAKINALKRKNTATSMKERNKFDEEAQYYTFMEQYSKEHPEIPVSELSKKFLEDYKTNSKAFIAKKADAVVNSMGISSDNIYGKEFAHAITEEILSPPKTQKEADEYQAKQNMELTIPKSATNGSGNYVIDPTKNLTEQLGKHINPEAIGTSKWFISNAKVADMQEIAKKIDAMDNDPEKRDMVIQLRKMYAKKLMPILEQLSDTTKSDDGDKKYNSAKVNLETLNKNFNVLLNTTSTATMKRIEEESKRVQSRFGNAASITNTLNSYKRASMEKLKDIEERNGKEKISITERANAHLTEQPNSRLDSAEAKYNYSKEHAPFRKAEAQLTDKSNKALNFLDSVSNERLNDINTKITVASGSYSSRGDIIKLTQEKNTILAGLNKELPKLNINDLHNEIKYRETLLEKGINVEFNKERIANLKKGIANYDKLKKDSDEAFKRFHSEE